MWFFLCQFIQYSSTELHNINATGGRDLYAETYVMILCFFLVLILIISNLALQQNSPGASQEEKQQQFGAI